MTSYQRKFPGLSLAKANNDAKRKENLAIKAHAEFVKSIKKSLETKKNRQQHIKVQQQTDQLKSENLPHLEIINSKTQEELFAIKMGTSKPTPENKPNSPKNKYKPDAQTLTFTVEISPHATDQELKAMMESLKESIAQLKKDNPNATAEIEFNLKETPEDQKEHEKIKAQEEYDRLEAQAQNEVTAFQDKYNMERPEAIFARRVAMAIIQSRISPDSLKIRHDTRNVDRQFSATEAMSMIASGSARMTRRPTTPHQ